MNQLIVGFLIVLGLLPNTGWLNRLENNLEKELAGQVHEAAAPITPQTLTFSPLPKEQENTAPLMLDSASFLVTDLDTNTVLALQNSDRQLQVASLTKLMTALVLVENTSLSQVTQVTDLSRVRSGDALMGLKSGEQISYLGLLKGVLIASGSDAAITVALNTFPEGYAKFIASMNERAKSIGMNQSHFDNPVGWDSQLNYSTAEDLTKLTRVILRDSVIRQIIETKKETVISQSGQVHQLINTNILLDAQRVRGVKTGFTNTAGGCLITLAKLEGKNVLTVVLGSDDRFGQTNRLLSGIEMRYNW